MNHGLLENPKKQYEMYRLYLKEGWVELPNHVKDRSRAILLTKNGMVIGINIEGVTFRPKNHKNATGPI